MIRRTTRSTRTDKLLPYPTLARSHALRYADPRGPAGGGPPRARVAPGGGEDAHGQDRGHVVPSISRRPHARIASVPRGRHRPMGRTRRAVAKPPAELDREPRRDPGNGRRAVHWRR